MMTSRITPAALRSRLADHEPLTWSAPMLSLEEPVACSITTITLRSGDETGGLHATIMPLSVPGLTGTCDLNIGCNALLLAHGRHGRRADRLPAPPTSIDVIDERGARPISAPQLESITHNWDLWGLVLVREQAMPYPAWTPDGITRGLISAIHDMYGIRITALTPRAPLISPTMSSGRRLRPFTAPAALLRENPVAEALTGFCDTVREMRAAGVDGPIDLPSGYAPSPL